MGGGGEFPSTGKWQGEVFAISDCLVNIVLYPKYFLEQHKLKSLLIYICDVYPTKYTSSYHVIRATNPNCNIYIYNVYVLNKVYIYGKICPLITTVTTTFNMFNTIIGIQAQDVHY